MMRICCICGNNRTQIKKKPSRYEVWYKGKQPGSFKCSSCYNKQYGINHPGSSARRSKKWHINNISYAKQYAKQYCKDHSEDVKNRRVKWQNEHPDYDKHSVRFKQRRVRLSFTPRNGRCEECGKEVGIDIKRTSLHHNQYHDEDVLKDTIELCDSCHSKKSRRDLGLKCTNCWRFVPVFRDYRLYCSTKKRSYASTTVFHVPGFPLALQ